MIPSNRPLESASWGRWLYGYTFAFFVLTCWVCLPDGRTHAESLGNITIDGNFDDWVTVGSHADPTYGELHDGIPDVHDTDSDKSPDDPKYVEPSKVNHPDVDILEYKFTHDENNLYAYFKADGVIGRTLADPDPDERGRYYVIVTIDVDNDDDTGYWLHEGGYYPTSDGYDMNMELEFYGGELNTGHYLSHDALTINGLQSDFTNLTDGVYTPAIEDGKIKDSEISANSGPYTPEFVEPAEGNYDNYTQWVYQENIPEDQIVLVVDEGPIVPGIVTMGLSADGHQLEMKAPFKGFLGDSPGAPNMALDRIIDISFSLEASGELALDEGEWASDTADPINGYVLGTSGPSADFNQDQDIDGDDFLAWQQNFGLGSGAVLSQGDANDDRRVGRSDQVLWQQQFGQPEASTAVTVPEPGSMLLALTLLFGLVVVRHPIDSRAK
jgi:hypothetical protein